MWDLPGPGLEPVSPALASWFLTTAPPGKSHCSSFSSGLSPPDSVSCRDMSQCLVPRNFLSYFPCSCDFLHLSFPLFIEIWSWREDCIIFFNPLSSNSLFHHTWVMYNERNKTKKWSVKAKILPYSDTATGERSLAWKPDELSNTEPQNFINLTSLAQQHRLGQVSSYGWHSVLQEIELCFLWLTGSQRGRRMKLIVLYLLFWNSPIRLSHPLQKHRRCTKLCPMEDVFMSYCHCNKLLQTQLLETTQIYSLTVLEVRSPKSISLS